MLETLARLFIIDIFAAFVAIACVTLGLFILYERYDKRDGRFLSFFIISVGLWILSVYYSDIATNLPQLVFWTKAAAIFALSFISNFVVFSYLFGKPEGSNKVITAFFVPAIIVGLFVLFFDNSQVYLGDPFENFTYDRPIGGILNQNYFLYVLFIIFYYILSFIVLLRGRKRLTFYQQNQIRYIVIGSATSMAAGIIFDGILPVYGIDYLYALGPIFGVFMVGFTVYAIVKHRLFDLRIVIQRGVTYSLLIGLIVGFYLLSMFALRALFQTLDENLNIISALITTLVGIFTVPVLDRYFRKITDKIFFKDKYDYSEAIHTLSEGLDDKLEFDQIINTISSEIKKILKVKSVQVLLDPRHIPIGYNQELPTINQFYPYGLFDGWVEQQRTVILASTPPNRIVGEQKLDYSGTGLIVMIVLEKKLLATIILGEKRSGDSFTVEDMQLMETFSHQAAVALKRAELYHQVKDYSATLEQKVKDRTAQLQELQEEQKQMMLDISHALQTPLTVIKSEAQIIGKKIGRTEDVEILEKSTDNISQFIYSLLKLARLGRVADESKKEKVNLTALVQENVEYVGVICQQRQITLDSKIEPKIVLSGFKDKLSELINNLLSNAIKYIGDKSKKVIEVTLSKSDDEIKLTIADNGIGISKENLPLLFRKFYRINSSESVKGTGLGLAYCKKIVELHNGRIDVESQPGIGTKFIVTFKS